MILDKIVKDKKAELKDVMARLPLLELKARARDVWPRHDFALSLKEREGVSIIAEVKKASPSKGVIRAGFDPVGIAKTYEENGATALSVLTEKNHFQGALEFIPAIREAVRLPILRKDFIFDEYQLYEARAAGADAVLLIASILDRASLRAMYLKAGELGLGVLAEAHDEADMEKVLAAGCFVIGINNRDLKTFKVDINTTGRLIKMVPGDRVVVSESGISTPADMKYLAGIGADAALIGEAFMREEDFGAKLRELAGPG